MPMKISSPGMVLNVKGVPSLSTMGRPMLGLQKRSTGRLKEVLDVAGGWGSAALCGPLLILGGSDLSMTRRTQGA